MLLTGPVLSRSWPFFLDQQTDILYQRQGTTFTSHQRMTYDFDRDVLDTHTSIPATAVPVYSTLRPQTISASTLVSQPALPQSLANASNFETFLADAAIWEKNLFQNLQFLQPEQQVWWHLTATSCTCVSDGSAPHRKGSFGWIISTLHGQRLVKCSGPVFGYGISSYRAESYGILSLLHFLFKMTTLHATLTNRLLRVHSLHCDNEGLVTTLQKLQNYPSVYPNIKVTPEWDCLAQILYTLKEMGSKQPVISHIRGHQDVDTPYEELTLSAQLNCDADCW